MADQPLVESSDVELRAWACYDFANSPYWQSYAVSLMPALMTWMAELYTTKVLYGTAELFNFNDRDPLTTIPGVGLTPKAFYPTVMSIAYLLQTLGLLCYSSAGDYGNNRKRLLMNATYGGSLFIMLSIVGVSSSTWWMLAVFRVLAGTLFALSSAWYNSYLAVLTASHPTVLEAGRRTNGGSTKVEVQEKLADSFSEKGFLYGYVGGVSSQLVVTGILFFQCFDSSCSEFEILLTPALCCALIGVWWAAFATIVFRYLKDRPGPPLPPGGVVVLGLKETCGAVASLRKYKNMMIFTAAYLLVSDAINTFTSVGGLIIASGEASADGSGDRASGFLLMITNIVAATACLIGLLIFPPLKEFFGASNKTVLILECGIFAFMCVGGGMGMVTWRPPFGFAIIMLSALLFLGQIQALLRSMFALLIPRGKESTFFALYAISDRGSNMIGTVVTAVVANATGSYVGVYWYLFLAFGTAGLLLSRVNVAEGIEEAAQDFSEEKIADGPSPKPEVKGSPNLDEPKKGEKEFNL
jgi:UMF1 family MFS transporter